jgi:ApaG protein
MYSATTHDITVTVQPIYLAEQSSPDEGRYVWAYQVRIQNDGAETVQLRWRYWQITDAMGRVQEVRGPGVVGEQPVLKPGDGFEYTSGTPLPTSSGIMVGTYTMEKVGVSLTGGALEAVSFEVAIPAFSLDSPHQTGRPN